MKTSRKQINSLPAKYYPRLTVVRVAGFSLSGNLYRIKNTSRSSTRDILDFMTSFAFATPFDKWHNDPRQRIVKINIS
jgi:hypothetical protein